MIACDEPATGSSKNILTGEISITGTVKYGETLTAVFSGDGGGLTTWVWVSGPADIDIGDPQLALDITSAIAGGETSGNGIDMVKKEQEANKISSIYIPNINDVGKRLIVGVAFANRQGYV